MAEYIEREKLIEHLKKDPLFDLVERYGITGVIESIPAADVRPVARGKWSKELHPNVRYNQYKCSICGEFSGHDSEGWIWKPNFCPKCGADMREEHDEKVKESRQSS